MTTAWSAGTPVAFAGVARLGALLVVLVAAGVGCRGPAPVNAFESPLRELDRERVQRVGTALLPGVKLRWRLAPRQDVGAWAWADGRIEVSPSLLDLLDDDELAAALAHEIGHLLDGGHLAGAPQALAGESGDLELRADRIACQLLARRGVSGDALVRMLSKLAYTTRDRDGSLAARIVSANAACSPGSKRR